MTPEQKAEIDARKADDEKWSQRARDADEVLRLRGEIEAAKRELGELKDRHDLLFALAQLRQAVEVIDAIEVHLLDSVGMHGWIPAERKKKSISEAARHTEHAARSVSNAADCLRALVERSR